MHAQILQELWFVLVHTQIKQSQCQGRPDLWVLGASQRTQQAFRDSDELHAHERARVLFVSADFCQLFLILANCSASRTQQGV